MNNFLPNGNINPSSMFGKVMLVFFWGMLAANIVLIIDAVFTLPRIILPMMVVLINMFLVWLKNWVFTKLQENNEK